ncbi:MAG: hypothetical protein HFH24_10890 [Ruminococcus sp.]|nr:hypothetical protein [Ruminococcus sp.]
MAINGINSYGMGLYSYQSTLNNFRLTQALAKNPKLNGYTSPAYSSSYSMNSAMKSNVGFVKEYSSNMTDLMSAANALKSSNKSSIVNDLAVTSSNKDVATAEARFSMKDFAGLELDVQQIAQAQVNVSEGVKASEKAEAGMNFTVNDGTRAVNVQVDTRNRDGSTKTNAQMLTEAANQINYSNSSVKASVVQKDGVASLQLESKSTGAGNTFSVSGDLGIASGAENVKTEAANAKYSVTKNGTTTNHESGTNEISLELTRVGVTLKGVGKTTIQSDIDTDKLASAVGDLVNAYNSSLKFLSGNYEKGTGVGRQLNNLVGGLGPERSLKLLGITVNKDASLSFDKDVFQKNMKKDPSLTKELVSGTNGIADRAYYKASVGLNMNSSSLLNGSASSVSGTSGTYGTSSSDMTNQYNVFNMYSRSGAFAMNNYAAVGMMLNYLI